MLRRAYSPRHVLDEVIAVPDIPYTISGKKREAPVKEILMGQSRQPGSHAQPRGIGFLYHIQGSARLSAVNTSPGDVLNSCAQPGRGQLRIPHGGSYSWSRDFPNPSPMPVLPACTQK